jgi:hypothetical protein
VAENVRDFKREKRIYEQLSWIALDDNGRPVC